MGRITRRDFLKADAGAVAGGVVGADGSFAPHEAQAAEMWTPQIEKGAKQEAAERAQKRAEGYYKV
jgi:anaerobic selenocysteine-containing dehydrogenase